jgi:hypothetical protein
MELTDARALVKDKTDKDITVRHLISVGGWGALARRLGEDEHRWALAGLFHDLDQDRAGEDSSRHAYLAADRDRDRPRHQGGVLREPGRSRPLRRADRYRPARDSVQPGHRCHHRGALSGQHPDLAAARAAGDRPWRRGVPVSTYRSGVRYDVTPGQLGRPVATFEAMTAGQDQVSATRATEAGATLAAGDNFASDIAAATVSAAILELVTLLAAALLATATYRARSRTTG